MATDEKASQRGRRVVARALVAARWFAIGLVVSCAIAWVLAVADRWRWTTDALFSPMWRGNRLVDVGLEWSAVARRATVSEHNSQVPVQMTMRAPWWAMDPDGRTDVSIRMCAFGWPLPALGMFWEYQMSAAGPRTGPPQFRLRVPGVRGVWLPLWPLWRGLLVDAALYGGVLWSLRAGRGAWVHRRRRRRGLCLACGYDLAGLPAGATCPECATAGRHPIPPRSRA